MATKPQKSSNREQNPRSLANLKPPWKRGGPSPNPSGRPKSRPITDEYYETSQEALPDKLRREINRLAGEEVLRPSCTWARANSIRRFLDAIAEGGQTSSKEIREAIEGKAPERLEIMGTQRKEITITIKHDRTKPIQNPAALHPKP